MIDGSYRRSRNRLRPPAILLACLVMLVSPLHTAADEPKPRSMQDFMDELRERQERTIKTRHMPSMRPAGAEAPAQGQEASTNTDGQDGEPRPRSFPSFHVLR